MMECKLNNCSWWSAEGCTASDEGAFCPLKKMTESSSAEWQDHDAALIKQESKPFTDFEQIVNEQFEICKKVLFKKAEEYATGKDRFHNFRLAAGLEGCSEKQALFGMMAKHVVSLRDMCWTGDRYPMELWDEKITDSINYLLLLRGLVVKEHEVHIHNVERSIPRSR